MTAAPRTRRARPGGRGGMTLVEVILTISIVVGIMGGVYAFYSSALSSRQRITDAAERVAAVRSIMDRMTTELRSAMIFTAPRIDTENMEAEAAAALDEGAAVADIADVAASDGEEEPVRVDSTEAVITQIVSRLTTIGMEGGAYNVSFATVALPGPSAWAESNVTDTGKAVRATGDVELIGYRLRDLTDDAGDVIGIAGLERSRKKELILSKTYEDEEANTEWVLVSRHIRYLRVRYWEGGDWIESWQGGDMPAAVEITLGFEPLPEDTEPEDYPYESYRRVVFIPGTNKTADQTTVRGLGEGASR